MSKQLERLGRREEELEGGWNGLEWRRVAQAAKLGAETFAACCVRQQTRNVLLSGFCFGVRRLDDALVVFVLFFVRCFDFGVR